MKDPELAVVDVWGDHFLVASLTVLPTDELNQGVVDIGTARKEETAARTKLMKEVELLILGGTGEERERERERESHKTEDGLTLRGQNNTLNIKTHTDFTIKLLSLTLPSFLWSLLAASSWKCFHSFSCLLSGKEMP